MKYPTWFARLCAAVVLVAPLSLPGAATEESLKELNLAKYVEPLFPDGLRFEGIGSGQVSIAFSRTAAGEPQDILVLSSTHPHLTAATLDAVRQWRFQPARNSADLGPRTVRLNFRMHGVVVYPFGKNTMQSLEEDAGGLLPGQAAEVPRVQEMAQAPKALNQPMPAYPARFTGRKVAGSAAVRFYVDEEGKVRLPQVTEATAPEFADAAIAAVSQWRYEPPQAGGRAIVVADNWAFQFKATN